MPSKQTTHKSINIRIGSYEQIIVIANQLSKEKGVPVTVPTTVQLLIDNWNEHQKGRK
jgi:hypothetical protein